MFINFEPKVLQEYREEARRGLIRRSGLRDLEAAHHDLLLAAREVEAKFNKAFNSEEMRVDNKRGVNVIIETSETIITNINAMLKDPNFFLVSSAHLEELAYSLSKQERKFLRRISRGKQYDTVRYVRKMDDLEGWGLVVVNEETRLLELTADGDFVLLLLDKVAEENRRLNGG